MTPKLLNILLLASSVVMYYMIINPLYFGTDSIFFTQADSIEKLTERVNTYNKTIETIPTLISQAKLNVSQFETISEDDRKKILTMVPVSIDELKLMSELTNIGIDSGTPIDSMGIKDKGNGIYSVTFSVNTTYANFKKIITVWENSMRLFTLQSISFNPGMTENEPVKFNVELWTYYMK